MKTMKTASLTAMLLFSLLTRAAHSQTTESDNIAGNLAEVLLTISTRFHISILGEMVAPIPVNLLLNLSVFKDGPQALDELVKEQPDYSWYSTKEGVVVFGQRKLLAAAGNPMNVRLKTYRMPTDLNIFKLTFPNAVATANDKAKAEGGVVTGIGLPPEMSPPLSKMVLNNVTAREVLIKVATDVGTLYSVIVLPTSQPKDLRQQAFLTWDIAGGAALPKHRTFIVGPLR